MDASVHRLWPSAVVLVLTAAAALVLYIIQQTGEIARHLTPVTFGLFAFTCSACLGVIRIAAFYHAPPNDIRRFVTEDARLATIRGKIISEPTLADRTRWAFGRFKPGDPSTSFYLRLNEAKTATGWTAIQGRIRVQLAEPVFDLHTGDRIQIYCWLEGFAGPTNPGQFDMAEYMARKGVAAAASVESRAGIEMLRPAKNNMFAAIRRFIRERAGKALTGDLDELEEGTGMLEALLLGYRGDIDTATYEAFRRTGLTHFISLSGLHLGILIGIVWWVCKLVGLLKRGRAVVCIMAIGLFLLIVPPRAPTLRAAIIGWLFCLSILLRRNPNSFNTLSLAAIVLLLLRPTYLFEAGWQLSFTTVLGILLFTDRIHNAIESTLARIRRRLRPSRRPDALGPRRRIGHNVIGLFAVGLAAWLGGAGILLYHFYAITPLASVWTVLMFPLVAGILTLGFLKMLLFYLLPTLSSILGAVAAGLAAVWAQSVRLLAQFDWSCILIGRVSAGLIVLYYCIVLFICFGPARRGRLKRIVSITAILILTGSLISLKWQRTHSGQLALTCLDVGHGQAIVARIPGADAFLFDAGSLHHSNIGMRVVAPFLDFEGLARLDTMVVSHNDVDHINGIPEIIQSRNVRRVCANPAFFERLDEWGTAKYLAERLKAGGVEITPVPPRLSPGDRTAVTILWPPADYPALDELSDNDRSLVILIEFAGIRVLLCSDIEHRAQAELLRLYPDLKAEVVIAPHHGSQRTTDPDFLERLNSRLVMCSRGNRSSKLSQNSTKNEHTGPTVLSTDADGAIRVTIDRGGQIQTATHCTKKQMALAP